MTRHATHPFAVDVQAAPIVVAAACAGIALAGVVAVAVISAYVVRHGIDAAALALVGLSAAALPWGVIDLRKYATDRIRIDIDRNGTLFVSEQRVAVLDHVWIWGRVAGVACRLEGGRRIRLLLAPGSAAPEALCRLRAHLRWER